MTNYNLKSKLNLKLTNDNLILIITIIILMCTFSNLFITNLYCDSVEVPKWSDHYSYYPDPQMFVDFLETLPDDQLEDWISFFNCELIEENDNEDDLWDLMLEDYTKYRFRLFWNSLTSQEQEAYFNHNLNKTRFWGGVFIVIIIILLGSLED